uniref:Malonyl-CoA decarboxylase C-terminal domain-containing protein n=1 Tax=Ciona savignyi TaxID=51511 RepID=H2ZBC1_CIOSA
MSLLGEVMKTVENQEKNKFQNFLVADETINRICEIYFTKLTVDEKAELLSWLCNKYGVQHHELYETCGVLQDCINNRVGMLQLTRITWETPADILEKVGKYEAVHQIRSWVDLKHRLGSNRRCYAFFHSSMPREPLVLLHVALTDKISSNVTSIVSYTDITPAKGTIDTTAIFYSITSTQNGLQGIDFGIHMIRKVVEELRK